MRVVAELPHNLLKQVAVELGKVALLLVMTGFATTTAGLLVILQVGK